MHVKLEKLWQLSLYRESPRDYVKYLVSVFEFSRFTITSSRRPSEHETPKAKYVSYFEYVDHELQENEDLS